ncbi:MAG: antibiotic biosynthesis monooxygenase family protein [Planctomycetota bacterium]
MRYIAMNRFEVLEGKESEFEAAWRERDSYLAEVPGFLEFRLLRGPDGVYISHAIWESEADFRAWTESESFRKAHAQGGARGLVKGPPVFSGYEVVLDAV